MAAVNSNQSISDHEARLFQHLENRLRYHIALSHTYTHDAQGLLSELNYLFRILKFAKLYSVLQPLVLELIDTLGGWPQRFGYGIEWEQEVRWAYETAVKLGQDRLAAAFLSRLAELCVSWGRDQAALNLCDKAIALSHSLQLVKPLVSCFNTIVSARSRTEDPADVDRVAELLSQFEQDPLIQQADPQIRAYALMEIYASWANLYRRQSQFAQSIAAADQSITWLAQAGHIDLSTKANLYRNRGILHWAYSEYWAAMDDTIQAWELYAQQGNTYARAYVRGAMGLIYWSMGELNQAEKAVREALDYMEYAHFYFRMAIEEGTLGLVYLFKGQLDLALQSFNRQWAIAEQHGQRMYMNLARGNMGVVQLHLGNPEVARTDLEYDLQDAERMRRNEALTGTYANLSRCYRLLNDFQMADFYAKQSFDLAHKLGLPAHRIVALRVLAENESPSAAEKLLTEALTLARKTHRRFDEAACLLSLSALAESQVKSRKLWEQGMRILEATGGTLWLKEDGVIISPFLPALA